MVRRCADIFCSTPLLLALCASLGLVACSGGDDGSGSGSSGRTVPASDGKGTFNVMISGDYKGIGTVNVGASTVHIAAAQVRDENGNVGPLNADGQMTTDSSHFSGNGTVLGKNFSFDGRADAQDATIIRPAHGPAKPEKIVVNSRVMVTFQTDDNHFGRVVGQH